jgi:hypothetical protein
VSISTSSAQRLAGSVRRAIIVVAGVVSTCFFFWVHSPFVKAFLLFWAVALLLGEVFRVICSLAPVLPQTNVRQTAGAAAIVAASSYYLLHGQSVAWMAFSWIALLYGVWAGITTLNKIAMDATVLRALWHAYKSKSIPKLAGVPFVYVIAEPGIGEFHSRRFIGKVMKALGKYRSIPRESGLSTRFHSSLPYRLISPSVQRAMAYFLEAERVQRYEKPFHDWLTQQACALIVARTSWGPAARAVLKGMHNQLSRCYGPVFDVCFVLGQDRVLCVATPGAQYIEVTRTEQNSLASLIAPLTDRLVATAIPIALSDANLSDDSRKLKFEIATSAIPPVADCYLRFRLAQSNIERFTALLDAYECLLKCSVMVTLCSRWAAGMTEVGAKAESKRLPTFGTWTDLLRQLLADKHRSTDLDRQVCDFWRKCNTPSQADFVTRVGTSGLPCPEFRDDTQEGWINWIKLLRDKTKGHGVVSEISVTPFWHQLHDIFLNMVSGLKDLTFDSHLLVRRGNNELSVRGWTRHGERAELKRFGSARIGEPSVLIEGASGELLQLSPLLSVDNGDFLVWDGSREETGKNGYSMEFISFASEKRLSIIDPERDLYHLWSNAAVSVSSGLPSTGVL